MGKKRKEVITVNDVGVDLLVDDGVPLDHSSHVGSGCLLDVFLNVVDDTSVDLTMEDGLHLDNPVIADSLLHDGGTKCEY